MKDKLKNISQVNITYYFSNKEDKNRFLKDLKYLSNPDYVEIIMEVK